jgi:hypothetical protein
MTYAPHGGKAGERMTIEETALVSRTLADLVAAREGADLAAGLDDFGWLDLFDDDPGLAVRGLFYELGRRGRWSTAFQDIAARALPTGPATRAVVVPRPRHASSASDAGSGLLVDGLVIGARSEVESYVVLVGDGLVERVVEIPSESLTGDPRLGLDGRVGTVHVSGQVTHAGDLLEGDEARGWWIDTEATLRLALCSFIAGGLRSMFELARDHAAEREQFGRRVGTFQAVRHKLAETYVAVEALDAACASAGDTGDRPLTAATTKLVASRSVSTVAAHTQQVLAGIGFTAEHPFHGFLKPVLMCDRLLGGASELAIEVGRCMVARAAAPRLVEL